METVAPEDRDVADVTQEAVDLDAASASSAAEDALTVRFDSFKTRASLIHLGRLR